MSRLFTLMLTRGLDAELLKLCVEHINIPQKESESGMLVGSSPWKLCYDKLDDMINHPQDPEVVS